MEEEGRRKLKKRILKMYGTQAGFAEKLGIRKKSYVTDLLNGKREFGEDTVRKWAALLDIRQEECREYFG